MLLISLYINPSRVDRGPRKIINLIFYFLTPCEASGFMEAFIKAFEATKSVKIKIYVSFVNFNTGIKFCCK